MRNLQKNSRRRVVRRPVKMPEPDDARFNVTMERTFYEPHYAARGLVLRRLSVEGVHPRVLAEFGRSGEDES